MRNQRILVALVALGNCFGPSGPTLAEDPITLPPAEADRQLLEQLATEHEVVRQAPDPGMVTWFQDLTHGVGMWLADQLAGRMDGVAGFAYEGALWAMRALFVLLVVLLITFLLRLVRRRQLTAKSSGTLEEAPAVAEVPRLDPTTWGERLRKHLAADDGDAAALALWWWLASALGVEAEPSWTTRELLRRSPKARDLRRLGAKLDRLIYGDSRPTAVEVEALWRQLEEALA